MPTSPERKFRLSNNVSIFDPQATNNHVHQTSSVFYETRYEAARKKWDDEYTSDSGRGRVYSGADTESHIYNGFVPAATDFHYNANTSDIYVEKHVVNNNMNLLEKNSRDVSNTFHQIHNNVYGEQDLNRLLDMMKEIMESNKSLKEVTILFFTYYHQLYSLFEIPFV